MNKKPVVYGLLLLTFFLSACNLTSSVTQTLPFPTQNSSLPTDTPPILVLPTSIPTTEAPLPVILPTTQAPPPTTASPTETTVPTQVSTGLPDITDGRIYLDDRSTPAALMLSYFNAINRQEYLRAYSYYTNFANLGTFNQFSSGYSDTKSVSVIFGQIFNEGAAGSIYYTVPMVLNATKTNGAQQKFAACYVLRFPQPGNYGAPPITPLHIDKGTAQSVALTTTDAAALAEACPQPDFPVGANPAPASIEPLNDLSSSNYIDNRSDPIALISSLLNAINKHEYVRAYSYWKNPPNGYTAFSAGYANTTSVTAQFGTATSDPGAGQINYALPVGLKATLTDGTEQTFIGCYTLHISQPSFQATPPFIPLGITGGSFRQVGNNADLTSLLATACQP